VHNLHVFFDTVRVKTPSHDRERWAARTTPTKYHRRFELRSTTPVCYPTKNEMRYFRASLHGVQRNIKLSLQALLKS